jgi:urease accessory protein
MSKPIRLAALSALAVAVAVEPAFAHTFGAHGAGFTAGFLHPFNGLDHLLAMVAVGLWAAQLGGRALWAVPAAFVVAMAAGGVMGLEGVALPHVEMGIAASIVLLGLLVGTAWRMPVWAGMLLVALFAIFHGHAHGTELPEAASEIGYGSGFVLATATLHGLGIGLGMLARRLAAAPVLRAAGGAITLAGLAFALLD